jgi:hypothetical protein
MDDFLLERQLNLPRWQARLSDGSVVIMDDGRPGTNETGWARLKKRLEQSNIKIVGVDIAFRANYINPVPDNARGYFFGQAIFVDFGGGSPTNYFLVGYVPDDSDVVCVGTWLVPIMIQVGTSNRSFDSTVDGLILN